jgi:hypothetical protein
LSRQLRIVLTLALFNLLLLMTGFFTVVMVLWWNGQSVIILPANDARQVCEYFEPLRASRCPLISR